MSHGSWQLLLHSIRPPLPEVSFGEGVRAMIQTDCDVRDDKSPVRNSDTLWNALSSGYLDPFFPLLYHPGLPMTRNFLQHQETGRNPSSCDLRDNCSSRQVSERNQTSPALLCRSEGLSVKRIAPFVRDHLCAFNVRTLPARKKGTIV